LHGDAFFVGKVLELPVTCTQDYTVFRILDDYSISLWKQQIARLHREHGLINLLIHPDFVIEPRAQRSYRNLLEHLTLLRANGHVWCVLPGDVANWWRQRSQMELVHDNGCWRVGGPGKERASVAYASLSGGTVAYSLPDCGPPGRWFPLYVPRHKRFRNLGRVPFQFRMANQNAGGNGFRALVLARSDLDNPMLVEFDDHLGAGRINLT